MGRPPPSLIQVDNRLAAPHLEREHRLNQVLDAYFEQRGKAAAPGAEPPWDAAHFGLTRVGLFLDARAEQQHHILADCAQGLLDEAYAIEKSGMTYCAKMSLLSETTEERMVYSLMAADEATHLQWVTPWVGSVERATQGAFIHLVSEAVEEGTRRPLVFLMQVVLEGWGLTHYRSLWAECRDEALRARLKEILRDEALHHSSGKFLFRAETLTAEERSAMVSFLRQLLGMVQVGPQAVAASVERHCGGVTFEQRVRVFEELDTVAVTSKKLQTLRRLMSGPEVTWLVEALDAHGAFTPLSAEACASAR